MRALPPTVVPYAPTTDTEGVFRGEEERQRRREPPAKETGRAGRGPLLDRYCHDIARLHLLPSFGNLKLKDLAREDIQSFYSRKREGSLSAASLRRVHDVLSSALNHAVKRRRSSGVHRVAGAE